MGTMKNLIDTEYAEALQFALQQRRAGTITRAMDDQLGNIAYSIATWAVADEVKAGRLWRTHAADDDFRSFVLMHVVKAYDKVDVNRAPKEILKYIYRCAVNKGIRSQLESMNCLKRKHESVPYEDCVNGEANFWGEQIKPLEYIENTGDDYVDNG